MSSYIEELDKKHCNDTDKKIIVRIMVITILVKKTLIE